MTQEEEQLLSKRIKLSDENAFKKVFELYYSRLCFYADRQIHDFDLSRSVVQQAFVDLWISRENLSITFSLKSFLFQMVRHKAMDVLKHRKIELKFAGSYEKEEPVSFHDSIEEAELTDRINASVQDLPPKCREIFTLCRFEGLKYTEIASRLNISVKTVEMQITIALKKIRRDLSDSEMIQLLAFIFSKSQ